MILMATPIEGTTPWVMMVENKDAGTCLGRVTGIHLYHRGTYLGIMVPSKYMSFLDVRNYYVEHDGEEGDTITVEMGGTE